MRHGVLCSKMQDRVTLYRVMELALKQLYVYRELSWHAFDVEGVDRVVEEKEGTRYETVIVRGVVSNVYQLGFSNDWFPNCILTASQACVLAG